MKNKFISKIASLLLLTVLISGVIGRNSKTHAAEENKTTGFIEIQDQEFISEPQIGKFKVIPGFLKFRYHMPLETLSEEMLNSEFQIHFIDVGAADCAVIKYGDKTWLVDAGFCLKHGITDVTKYLPEVGIDTLYGVILTHAHTDHYWKLKYIFERFNPKKFYRSYDHGVKSLLDIYEKISYTGRYIKPLQKFMSVNGSDSCIDVSAGYKLFEDENLKIQVIGPTQVYKEENDNSIVLLVQYKEKRILLMGDAGVQAESDIIKYCSENNIDISNVDIVKIGHHGSNTSSSLEFVNLANPGIIVNSTGGNDLTLGTLNLHEHSSIISRWIVCHFNSTGKKQQVLTTEEQNNIVVYYQDGKMKSARKDPVT